MKSILSKLWFGITALVLIILLLIWLFQITFLNEFYIRQRKDILIEKARELSFMMVESKDYRNLSQEMMDEIYSFTASISAVVMVVDKKNNALFVNTPDHYLIHNKELNKKIFKSPIIGHKEIEKHILEGRPFEIKKVSSKTPEASVVVGIPVIDKNEILGSIVIFSTLAPIEEATAILKKQLSIITILSLAIGTLLALSLAKFFTKPIMNIISASKRIAKGDFSVEIVYPSNDEIGVLGETINDMARQLDKIEKLRREFIANVSHELKTPISLIKAYAEVVKDMESCDEKDKELYLGVIIDESDRLNNIVEDILYLSKMESGYLDLVYDFFSLTEVLDCVIEKLSYFISNRKLSVVTEKGSEDFFVYADKNKIYQVFYNIINNAINYSHEGGEIILKIYKVNGALRAEIIDNGVGIPKEDIRYLWDRFYKVDKSRKREHGTGLGLAIVKNILQAHRFQYGLESELNKGTLVWIEFPDR